MKKIVTLCLLISILASSVFALSSCTGDDKIPDGMQLVAGGESLGYYFYAPEEWTVSNIGRIKSAYASRVDTSSVSFTEVYPKDFLPSGTENAEEYFFSSYFTDSLSEFPNEPKVTNKDGENIIFGKEGELADKAKKYTFTYDYYDYTANETYKFGFMQILLKKADRYYIFSYSASMKNRTGSDKTYYDYYLGDENKGKIYDVINNFRFVEKKNSEETSEPIKDADGYILISDSALSGFKLYVPEGFMQDYSSAIVSATHADGSNVNMTEANGTNENVNSYMLRRFGELESIIGSKIEYEQMRDEKGELMYDSLKKPVVSYKTVKFGNATLANAYEYSYSYNGEKYKVYQVVIIDGWALSYKGYVFTYTAKEANYSLHYDEIIKTTEKVIFK